MATLAKIIGGFCLAGAAGGVFLAVYAFGSFDWQRADDTYVGGAMLILMSIGAVTLLLAGVGAVAYLVGEAAEREADRRAVRMARPLDSSVWR